MAEVLTSEMEVQHLILTEEHAAFARRRDRYSCKLYRCQYNGFPFGIKHASRPVWLWYPFLNIVLMPQSLER
ncbi:MAG: hypothetical protein U5L09_08385 [Bacteroidales bacterium]|nr:hypothetical protein [Bacteroidales bacterium]